MFQTRETPASKCFWAAAFFFYLFVPAEALAQQTVVKFNPVNAAFKETGIALEQRFGAGKTGGTKGLELEAAWMRPAFQFGDRTLSRSFNGALRAEGWHFGLYFTTALPRASHFEDLNAYARFGGYARGLNLRRNVFAGSGSEFARYEASVFGLECSWHFPGILGWDFLEPYAGLGLRFRRTRKQFCAAQTGVCEPVKSSCIAHPVPVVGCRMVLPVWGKPRRKQGAEPD